MSYDPQIHNKKSIRLKGHDYGEPGNYFVTICTKDRKHYFGEILDYKIQLSKIGEVVFNEWMNTQNIRQDVKIGEFVIMPNHIHGIISIVENVGIGCANPPSNSEENSKESILNPKPIHKFGPQSNNLFLIIGGFKGAVTKKLGRDSIWQSRFYDHIIRNQESHNKIYDYIKNNPYNWQFDIENERFNKVISEKLRKEHYQQLFFCG